MVSHNFKFSLKLLSKSLNICLLESLLLYTVLSLKYSRSDVEVLAAGRDGWPLGTAQCQLYALSVLIQPTDARRTLRERGRALSHGRVPGSIRLWLWLGGARDGRLPVTVA